jgi:succinate dehydrogenase / fumarate reductase flavoprotein subunit
MLAHRNSDLIETLEYDNLILQAVTTMDSAPTHRVTRRPRPRGLSSARRPELDEAHAGVLDEETRDVRIDYRARPHLHVDQRGQYIPPKQRCTRGQVLVRGAAD